MYTSRSVLENSDKEKDLYIYIYILLNYIRYLGNICKNKKDVHFAINLSNYKPVFTGRNFAV